MRRFSKILCLLRPFFCLVRFVSVKKRIIVLTFHEIPADKIEWFDSIVMYISKHYKVITPSQLSSILVNTDSDSSIYVLFTFDDGFKSNRYVAEAVLSKYNIKAIFFLLSSFIGLDSNESKHYVASYIYREKRDVRDVPANMKAMSSDDVRWLIENGHEIGAHTAFHTQLSNEVNIETLKSEIIHSKLKIEKEYNLVVKSFAYPFGGINSLSEKAIKLVGSNYLFGFSNIRGVVVPTDDTRILFRQNITPNNSLWFVKLILEGVLDVLYLKYRNTIKEKVRCMSLFEK